MISKRKALLFKTQTEQSSDKYEALLQSNQIDATTVNTLVFDFVNLDLLAKNLQNFEDYSGIIFSSPRCVNAVYLACKQFNCDLSLWRQKNNFAVGTKTAQDSLDKLRIECKGADSGSAVNLAKEIIKEKTNYRKPFLYPHGSLKTDTLTAELEKENICLDGILVYHTKENPNIEEEMKKSTQNFQNIPEFLVFFSPSGVQATLSYLSHFTDSKVIAIGPTTETALKEKNIQVSGVAKQPTPQDVLDQILQI
ncbi:unnamed protein product [Phyllotreta striolata]|uniref:Uroporphyrinogen-III synthase n=1 Tax=Phyllotreta striolata TaxID=444603 RepID=A0A9N9TVH9_PHYSR|nr:unnamed protein product [Phyllotreta striolata]